MICTFDGHSVLVQRASIVLLESTSAPMPDYCPPVVRLVMTSLMYTFAVVSEVFWPGGLELLGPVSLASLGIPRLYPAISWRPTVKCGEASPGTDQEQR